MHQGVFSPACLWDALTSQPGVQKQGEGLPGPEAGQGHLVWSEAARQLLSAIYKPRPLNTLSGKVPWRSAVCKPLSPRGWSAPCHHRAEVQDIWAQATASLGGAAREGGRRERGRRSTPPAAHTSSAPPLPPGGAWRAVLPHAPPSGPCSACAPRPGRWPRLPEDGGAPRRLALDVAVTVVARCHLTVSFGPGGSRWEEVRLCCAEPSAAPEGHRVGSRASAGSRVKGG